ncbi:MAG: GNAT family N-acetyltransferase [Rhodobacteraceae bacterium]|nr:GNAT family N-acetyltransferase [Paracoccaceae bacterium]
MEDFSAWNGAEPPVGETLTGRFARLEKLSADRHGATLFEAFAGHDPLWEFIGWGPFPTAQDFHTWATAYSATPGFCYYAICDAQTGAPKGQAALMRMKPAQGVIEVGGITYAPTLQRQPAATEAMILLMRWAFAHGYRRYEWKCDARNLPSRRAAQRLGFSYEGIFRQHMVVKGKNRDTAWFAITDKDWPRLNEAYEAWLSPTNFDERDHQKTSLSTLTAPIRVTSDPALTAI